jgi:hypothetical protein
MEDLPFQMAKSAQKKITGALLAEISQSYLDESIGLPDKYKPLLQQLIRDPEIVRHAEDWMDYSLKILIYDEEYWSNIKEKMQKLQEEGI